MRQSMLQLISSVDISLSQLRDDTWNVSDKIHRFVRDAFVQLSQVMDEAGHVADLTLLAEMKD